MRHFYYLKPSLQYSYSIGILSLKINLCYSVHKRKYSAHNCSHLTLRVLCKDSRCRCWAEMLDSSHVRVLCTIKQCVNQAQVELASKIFSLQL